VKIASYTSFDGAKLAFRHWRNDEAEACAIILHGIQSHSGWYESSGRYFFEGGLEVAALDRRGSGLNRMKRGDMPGFKALVEDIRSFIELIRKERGIKRFHLAGISWGGKLAALFSLIYGGLIESQILLSPGIYSKVGFSRSRRLSILLHRLFRPARLIPIPIDKPEMFTSNPEKIEYIRNDELSLRCCTARFFFESYRMEKLIEKEAGCIRTPTFLALAGVDDIVDNDRVRNLVESFAAVKKETKLYPNACHTLEFEKNPIPVFEDILRWMKSFP